MSIKEAGQRSLCIEQSERCRGGILEKILCSIDKFAKAGRESDPGNCLYKAII